MTSVIGRRELATLCIPTHGHGHSFGRREHLTLVAAVPGIRASTGDQRVDLVVGAARVMVIERNAGNVGAKRHVDHVLDGAVPPPHMVVVLRREVLRVVNQQVRAGEPTRMGVIVAIAADVAANGQFVVVGLVVGGVHHDRTIRFEPVSERQRRMVEEPRLDTDVSDVEPALDQVLVGDRCGELIDRHWKVRVLHLAGEDLGKRSAEAARTRDLPMASLSEERREERQPLDVVPVGVTDQDVAVDRLATGLRHQVLAEPVRSGAAVDHHQRSRI